MNRELLIELGEAAGVLVVHSGDFGAAIASEVVRLLPSAGCVDGDVVGVDTAAWPSAELIVLATSCPRVDLEHAVDGWAMAGGTTIIPISLEHPYLRIGPTLGPATTATLDCLRRRLLQHSPDRSLRKQAYEVYRETQVKAPLGYLPCLVTFAVQTALAIRRRLVSDDDVDLQQVYLLDTNTLEAKATRLIGCHGNPRSAWRDRESERSFAQLLPVVARLAELRGAR